MTKAERQIFNFTDKEMKENKKAIIIGATSGIGMEVCHVLTDQGWQLGIAGRREEVLAKMASENKAIVVTKRIDITKDDAPQQLEALIEAMQGIDLYFHSSGIGFQNPSLDMEKEMATVETNAVGFTRMVGVAFDYFANHPDRTCLLSDKAIRKPLSGMSNPAMPHKKDTKSQYSRHTARIRKDSFVGRWKKLPDAT